MTDKNGGPAFARPFSKAGEYSDSIKHHAQEGMSLRDYFAAKVFAATITGGYWTADGCDSRHMAMMSYKHADAMLVARNSPAEPEEPNGLLEAVKALIAAEDGISIVNQKSEDAFERVRRIAERAK